MVHALPHLSYGYADLEPYIDEETLEVHHSGHHRAYVEKLNKALEGYPEWQDRSVEELLRNLDRVPIDFRDEVRKNGGGHFNHSLMWEILSPPDQSTPSDELTAAMGEAFDGFTNFQERCTELATTVFGSGYVWLSMTSDGSLVLLTLPNQDCPLSIGLTPVFLIDLWEHAYYLKHQNRREEYVDAYWKVVNWRKVSDIYAFEDGQRKMKLSA